jgi:hypothetical protein
MTEYNVNARRGAFGRDFGDFDPLDASLGNTGCEVTA